MINDLRFAIRMLVRSPAFSILAILTLALAIGANSAVFSVINAVLLRPLPYENPEQLVRVFGTQPQLAQAPTSPANFLDWKEQNQAFERIATFVGQGFNLLGGDKPERVRGARVSADLFQLLGMEPALGRTFQSDEEQRGPNRVVVLSHDFWRSRFAGDDSIIGKSITLNDQTYTVIGVMPAGFAFPNERTQLWTPIAFSDTERATRDTNYIDVIARLKPGVTLAQAQEHMSALARQQAQRFPDTNTGIGVKLVALGEHTVGNIRPVLVVLLAAVAFVLLIACANVANLLLARAADRQREMAIRSALGASRSRVVRLLLVESVVIAVVGGAAGLMLAIWGIDLLVALKPGNLPRVAEISIDRGVFGFAALLSLITGVGFGLVPAWHVSKPDLNEGLKESSRGTSGGPGRQRLRGSLVVCEIALSLVLLIGAGLMIRSFARLLAVDPGFNPTNVLQAFVSLPSTKYPDARRQAAFFDALLERTRNLAGVIAIGAVSDLPLLGGNSTVFDVEGRAPAQPGQRSLIDYRAASADYFSAMGMRLVKGRAFSARDTADAPGVVIINETTAARFFPNEDPIGKRIALSGPPDLREIVGVVADVRNYGLDADVKPEAYVPFVQNAPEYLSAVAAGMNIVVRTASDASAFAPTFRAQVQAIDKDQPISELSTMEAQLAESIAQRRFNMLLLAVFAGLALVLAAVGIYGVVGYTVAQRSHEMGIRMALGASRGDILRLVFGHSMLTTLAGIAVGLIAALALTRLISSLLYDVAPTDPLVFAGITSLLVLVASTATYLPARRAMRVNPIEALRHE